MTLALRTEAQGTTQELALLGRMEQAQQLLAEASDDFARLRIRDEARAVAAAAAILNLGEVQLTASFLVSDAERAIAFANDPIKVNGKKGRGEYPGCLPSSEGGITRALIHHCRSAHRNLTEDEYESVKQEFRAKQLPLTRGFLMDVSKRKRRAERERTVAERRDEGQAAVAAAEPAGPDFHLYVERCSTLNRRVEPESVDVIITDPPYPREFLHCYEELVVFAEHALKPGGSLVTLAGQSWLPDVLQILTAGSLTYQWALAYETPGAATRIFGRQVGCRWKPLLWLVKGKYGGGWLNEDVVVAPGARQQDTDYHEWGQNAGGMSKVVSLFAQPGDLVVDPFVGGGTAALAALERGCRFVGADIDAGAIETTGRRIS